MLESQHCSVKRFTTQGTVKQLIVYSPNDEGRHSMSVDAFHHTNWFRQTMGLSKPDRNKGGKSLDKIRLVSD